MTRQYRVLVADNLPSEVESVARELDRLGEGVDIVPVSDASVALAMALDDYFHAVIVDLRWDKDFQVGAEILRRFRDHNSAEIRCMMTKYVAKADELLALLKDTGRVADILYDKQDQGSAEALLEVLSTRVESWRGRAVQMDGLAELVDAVAAKGSRLGLQKVSNAALKAEIVDLLEDVFGESLPELGDDQTVKVELNLMAGGLSAAILVEARPVLGTGEDGIPITGNQCILKFDSASGTRAEAGAYVRSVRFSVALNHRVEMLATSTRARLGVICYSFAGGSQSAVRQLDSVAVNGVSTNGAEIGSVFRSLFSVESKRWYDVIGPARSLREYFHDQLNFSFKKGSAEIEGWAKKLARRDGVYLDGQRLVIGDCRLTLPGGDTFGSAVFTRPQRTCLIHGDLHGGNVMIAEDGRVSLIDFANTGIGPRYFDAATLQGSIRLWSVGSSRAPGARGGGRLEDVKAASAALQRVIQLERKLLTEGNPRASEDWVDWAAVLDRQMAANFGSDRDEDQLATYAAQAIRLACHPAVTEQGRLRCLAWYTALEQRLRGSGAI